MTKIRVAILGCGGFAQGMHIPLLKENKRYSIDAVMDIDQDAAKKCQELTGAKYWTNDAERVFSDPDIDAVFIITTHDSHAQFAIRSAEAGKHVFCEKPMALNIEDCQRVTEAVTKAGVKYTIGYNRGLAPLIQKAKSLLAEETSKMMLYHRIQALFPVDHWTHNPQVGGGRFVGEGCHIFDLFCEIVDKEPVMVYAAGGTFLDAEKVLIPDSSIVTITFTDGSIATTLIASAGCDDFPKESTEIYCNKKAISIENFRKMDYYGFEGHKQVSIDLNSVDKGQNVEIDLFADAVLNDVSPPNGLVKAARSAVISFKVNESVATGKPVTISSNEYLF
jgi:predicted dehydrogenase